MIGTASEAMQPATLGDKLRHIGVSLLPLALFVGGSLGYEQIVHATRVAPAKAVAAAVTAPIAIETPSAVQRGLRDERSLDDLARVVAKTEVRADERQLTLTLGESAPLALGFDMKAMLQPGAYGILRGVPANATLSHGIAAGRDNWLVDGSEIEALRLAIRTGKAGKLGLDLTLLSKDSRPLARERVAVTLREAAPRPVQVQSAPPASDVPPVAKTQNVPPAAIVQVVPPAVVAMPTAAPVVDAASIAAEVAPASVVAVASAAPATLAPTGPMQFSLTRAEASGGRYSLRLGVEPRAAIPDRAYVLLRGVPSSIAMSRGMSIGADVWLLSVVELADLEMRLSEAAPANLSLGAKLLTSDGRLLAEETLSFVAPAVVGATAARNLATSSTAVREVNLTAELPAAATAIATARLAAVAPQAALPATLQPAVPVAPPAARVVQRTPTLEAPAQQAIYERGRKMLLAGNIAVARPLLERAAAGGSAEAAVLLGASYDASWLKRVGALGVVDDPARSKRWYEEARRLGAQDVERIVAGTIPAPATPRR